MHSRTPPTRPPRSPHSRRAHPHAAAARWRLAGTVAAAVGLLAALVRSAGRAPFAVPGDLRALPHRLAVAAPLDAVAVVAHRVALVLTAWLTLVTVGHLVAALARRPRALRISERFTPLALRRLVAAAVVTAGTVAATGPWAPAGADPRPGAGSAGAVGEGTVVTVRNGRAGPDAAATNGATANGAPATPTTVPAGVGVGSAERAVVPVIPLTRATGGTAVTAAPGDSLWTLTRDAVARETGRDPGAVGSDEIAPRWVLVCDANRDRLRSGDVNLLAPGEEVVIPPG